MSFSLKKENWLQGVEARMAEMTELPTLFCLIDNTSRTHFCRLHCSSTKHQHITFNTVTQFV